MRRYTNLKTSLLPVLVLIALGFSSSIFAGCNSAQLAGPEDGSTLPRPDLAMDNSGGTVTVTMDSFVVPAGAEVYKCQNFVNPFGGADVEVKQFESHMTAGSHHLLVFYKNGLTSSGPLGSCSGLEFAATPYGSQRRDDLLTFPPGVAAFIPGTQGMRFQSHYLNATDKDITASVAVTFHKALPGTITDHAGVLFFVNTDLKIPSTNMPFTLQKTCPLTVPVNIIQSASHMHQHAVGFTASSDTSMIYQTREWNEPTPAVFAPPLHLEAGSSITFGCTWVNNSGATLTFGESAMTNEMCIFTAQFYPIVGKSNVIPCF